MQWNEGFEWAPFGVLWIKSLFMNDYNEPLKHHRCRICWYKDQSGICHNVRVSADKTVTLLHRWNIFMAKSKDYSSQTSLLSLLILIVSWSASQTAPKTKKVHSWGASVFLLKILIKHHLFISVSIPNVDMFKFSSL